MYFPSAFSFLLCVAAFSASAQQLNRWQERPFPIAYSPLNSSSDNLIDGNVNTTYRNNVLPLEIMFLFNRGVRLKGLYVKSSGNYITDYYVEATDPRSWTRSIVGSVSDAKAGFTAINFWDLGDQPIAYGSNWYLTVTKIFDKNLGVYRNSSQSGIYGIDEIYPIYPEDDIVYPPGQSAGPIPTQTNTPVPVQTSLPQYPSIKFNHWPRFLGTFPEVYTVAAPYRWPAAVDNNPSSALWQPLSRDGYQTEVYVSIIDPRAYSGLYILSDLRDYTVYARNMGTNQDFEVCRIAGSAAELSVCRFVNEKGEPLYKTNFFVIKPIAIQSQSNYFSILEIYAIYPGEDIIEQTT